MILYILPACVAAALFTKVVGYYIHILLHSQKRDHDVLHG